MISDAASRNAEEESRPSRHAVVLVLTAEYFFMPLVAKLIVAVVVGAGATFANGINAFVVAIQKPMAEEIELETLPSYMMLHALSNTH